MGKSRERRGEAFGGADGKEELVVVDREARGPEGAVETQSAVPGENLAQGLSAELPASIQLRVSSS